MTEIADQIDILMKALLQYEDFSDMVELRLEDETMQWYCNCCEEGWIMGTQAGHASDCVIAQAKQILKERGAYDSD